MNKLTPFICSLMAFFCLGTSVNGQLTFTAVTQNGACDDAQICVNITADGLVDIAAFQFGVGYDSNILTYESSSDNLPDTYLGNNLPSEEQFAVSWFNLSGINFPNGDVAITICFEPTGTIGTSPIEFVSRPGFPIEARDINNNVISLGMGLFVENSSIEITDMVNPTIDCPSSIMAMGNAPLVVNNIGPTSVFDNCGIDNVSYNLSGVTSGMGMNDASGIAFNEGITTVEYTVEDGGGNINSCQFEVEVSPAPTNDTIFKFKPLVNLDCTAGSVEYCVTVENFDSIRGLAVPFVWDETQLDYLSNSNTLAPGFMATAETANGVAAFIYNNPDALTLADGDTIFCSQFAILDVLDSPMFSIENLPLLLIEVTAAPDGTMGVQIPFEVVPELVSVTDNVDPVISNCPSDVTITLNPGECSSTHSWPTPTFSDDCTSNLTIDSTHASGDVFSIGSTTVTYTATDFGGNMASCSFVVTIVDNEDPSLTCPSDTMIMMGGPVIVSDIAATASDCGNISISYELSGATSGMGTGDASGESFETGMTTVTYTVIDDSGNDVVCSFVVTVDPGTLPTLDCPNDTIVSNAMGTCDNQVAGLAPTVTSDPSEVVSITYATTGATVLSGSDDISGSTFNVGITVVTYTVTDNIGQMGTCSFNVEVRDTTPPTGICPTLDVFDSGTDMCGVTVSNNLLPVAVSDNCGMTSISYLFSGVTDGSGTGDPTGTFFNVGTTIIAYTITDEAGNEFTCNVNVVVTDSQNPTIDCPNDTTVMIPFGQTNAIVNTIDPIFSDNCPDPALTHTIGAGASMTGSASGSSFGIGTTLVTYTITDASGTAVSCSFNVTVEETPIGALVNCPNDTMVNNDAGMCSAVVNDIAPNLLVDNGLIQSVSYALLGTNTIGSNNASGISFPVGTNVIRYYVTSNSGMVDSCDFTVTVIDAEAPIFTNCPSDTIKVYVATDDCRQLASWTVPIAADNCGIGAISNSHSPLDTFDLGSTTVSYTAMDATGLSSTCEFIVSVIDTIPPTFTCPGDFTVSAGNNCTAPAIWDLFPPMDNCGIAMVNSTANSGDDFPVGINTVEYQIVDNAGNETTCSFTITVNDTTAPLIDCPTEVILSADGTILSDPEGFIASTTPVLACDSITISFNTPSASDACEGTITVTQTAGLMSGQNFGVGDTPMGFSASDFSGNTDMCSFVVIVEPADEEVILAITSGDPPCIGDELIIGVQNLVAGAIYTWSGPNGYTATGTAVGIQDVDESNNGLYTVSYFIAGGCAGSGEIQIEVTEPAEVEVGSNSPICSGGGSLELTASPVAGAMVASYSWTGPDGFNSTAQNPVIANAGSANQGVYNLDVTSVEGCVRSYSVTVTVGELSPPSINSDCGEVICVGESCTLLGTEYAGTGITYNWSGSPTPAAGLPLNSNIRDIQVTPTAAGIYVYNYSVTIGNCTSESAQFILNVEGSPEAVNDMYTTGKDEMISNENVLSNDLNIAMLGGEISLVETTIRGFLTLNPDGTFTYIPNEGYIGFDKFEYRLCSNCPVESCDTAEVIIDVKFDGDACEVPTVITPNGDGMNDAVVIDCVASGQYKNNSIKVFNQWGDEVYSAAPYQNDWEGTFKGEPLPDGTYFIIFNDGEGSEPFKGAITIFR